MSNNYLCRITRSPFYASLYNNFPESMIAWIFGLLY
jgi:hypothetical protein